MSANVSNADRSLIYDVGLHLGEDAEFYLKKRISRVGNRSGGRPLRSGSGTTPAVCQVRTAYDLERGDNRPERSNPFFFVNEANSVWGTTSERWAERNRRFGAGSTEVRVEGPLR
jgi:hypothetical protein